MTKKWTLFFLFIQATLFAQPAVEKSPPYYIKSVYFEKSGQSQIPIFSKNSTLTFRFDDLLAANTDYYYTISYHNYDWSKSDLVKTEYLTGMDDVRIKNSQNSFNTLQSYTHYAVSFPNADTKLSLSGNYMIHIYDQDRNEILSRKFIIYEDRISIGVDIARPRNLTTSTDRQNVYFSYDYGDGNYNNPRQNFKIAIFQNGRFDNTIVNVKPQYVMGTQFRYRYEEETQFWAGNEFWYYENSRISQVNNMIKNVTSDSGLYNNFLYPYEPRNYYTFWEDLDGAFIPNNRDKSNHQIEADYAWVYFSLKLEEKRNEPIYIVGQFNNYEISDDYLLEYNSSTGLYEIALLLKQGFVNYRFVTAKGQKIDDKNSIDGNFYETENTYQVLLYYRGNNDRYDAAIGYGDAKSINITQ